MEYNSYDKIPVYYCKKCNSLRIMQDDSTLYCDNCGSTEIDQTSIYKWVINNEDAIYKNKDIEYGAYQII